MSFHVLTGGNQGDPTLGSGIKVIALMSPIHHMQATLGLLTFGGVFDRHPELRVVSDGKEAIEYLFQRGRYQAPGVSPRPDLILLDLNLPGISGMEVLQAAKGDADLRSIPIVVVTTSIREQDVADAYEIGCNSYVVKSLEARGFIEALRDIYSYWFGLCALPSHEESLR